VALPAYLSAGGLRQVIPPLPSRSGQLWASLGAYKLILYPFVEGADGYQSSLSEAQWQEFGAAVKRIHAAELPPGLLHQVRREAFDPRGRNRVKDFQAQAEQVSFGDPVANRLAAFMRTKQSEISLLVARAERLGSELAARQLEPVLCHSDLHAGNLHLAPDGALYLVDWDNPILAPKECDLMHIGASARWDGKRIKSLFYRGYGEVQVDGMALAYYRCERVIQDIAEFCTFLLSGTQGGSDREQSLGYFTSQFEPGQEVEIAIRGGNEKQLRFYGCFTPRERR
jgi:spectinomycin phosphotransferase